MIGLFHDISQDAVTELTPLDEVMQFEMPEGETEAMVILPREDYELLMAHAGAKFRLPIDAKQHRFASEGVSILEAAELEQLIRDAKHQTLCAFLRYIWFNAANLWQALKNLCAITQKWRPDFIRGMSGAEVAKLLGESRQAHNKLSVKMVAMLERWGLTLDDCAGGSRGKGHQKKKAGQMKGRRHRAADYKAEHEEIPLKPISERARQELHRKAEERRLAAIVPGRGAKEI